MGSVHTDDDVRAIEALVRGARDAFNASDNGQFARYDLTEVRFLREDVALGYVEVNAVTESREPLELDHSMESLFVVTREHGEWVVAARQDTIVPRQGGTPAPGDNQERGFGHN